MAVEVFVPKMSDHMEAGVILSWLSKEGEKVERGQPILELETDKAAVELEAPESGYLKGIRAGVVAGANVPVGETIAFIARTPEEGVPVLPPLGGGAVPPTVEAPAEPAPAPLAADAGGPVRAAPAVRRVARELGVDLKQVKGSGPEGRVLDADVRAYVEARKAPAPLPAAAPLAAPSVSPVARRMAQELGVDLSQVKPGDAA
jgi:pyruvate dehydrogenase E2 component (dihydrolipoamide acetyltransferase)